MGSLTPAIERLQKKLEKEPNSLAFCQLADEYRKEGMYQEALKTCREGLRRHPNYSSALAALGRIQYEMGDFSPAGESLEKVIRSVPDNLLANRLLGDIYVRQGRNTEALKRYRMVQMITPADQVVNAQIQKLEQQIAPAPQLEERKSFPVQEAEPFAFPELQPQPMGELEETLSEPVPEPTEQFEKTQPDRPLPDLVLQAEPEETIRVEPEAYSIGDTFRLEEHNVIADTPAVLEQIEPPEPAHETPVQEAPVQEAVVQETPVEETIAQTETMAYTESALTTGDFSFEGALITPVDSAHEEPVVASVEEEKSDGDRLADIASIFLEDQPREASHDMDSLDIPDEAIVDLTYESGDSDDLEQVLEEASGVVHRDTTQPIDSDQDDTDVNADELTTETLAELYLQQGSPERAIKVYQKLLLNDPGNARIQQKLAELNPVDALIASASGQEQPEAESMSAHASEHAELEHATVAPKTAEEKNEERQRKINTLESWLTSIRRER